MNALRRLLLISLLVALSGCGFALRGAQTAVLPMQQMALTVPSGPYPLQGALEDTLEASNVEIVHGNGQVLELALSAEQLERRAISINTRAGAGQYELMLSVDAALRQGGQVIAGPETFQVRGTFYEDTANISGSNSGLELTLNDMRRELADNIVRRLQAVEL
ncbi:MAG: LPS assembly lipoprotein LptE [Pseudomonadota bacterium]|nr:LPS assembly lipoprotein LptE [Pseudomonadota bacterium]